MTTDDCAVELTLEYSSRRHHMVITPSTQVQNDTNSVSGSYPTVFVDAFGLVTVMHEWLHTRPFGVRMLFSNSTQGDEPFTLTAQCKDGTIGCVRYNKDGQVGKCLNNESSHGNSIVKVKISN